jgi:DNA ligase-1
MKVKSLMLADDWDENKLVFPLLASPKIDGVRGANFDGTLRGRSLKTHANKRLTEFFSVPEFLGFDGELVAAGLVDPDLCRKTSSACSTIDGSFNLGFCVFDYYTEATKNLRYIDRYHAMLKRMAELHQNYAMWLRPVEVVSCENLEELLALEEKWLDMGYEGVIIRDPNGLYKEGRATVKQRQILRIKRFVQEDALVLSVVEGESNHNEPLINERGLQYRQTLASGMVPNGLVGKLQCKLLKNILDPVTKEIILREGDIVTVSPGKMTQEERALYFAEPDLIVGKVISFKFFPRGIKDKPRYPTYVHHRDPVDVVRL